MEPSHKLHSTIGAILLAGMIMRRNRKYADTHRVLVEKAVGLITQSGIAALTVSAVARAAGINRSTVHYHFATRQALISAVHEWSSAEIIDEASPEAAQRATITQIPGFVIRNPELIKMWIADYINTDDAPESYPQWDYLVAHIVQAFADLVHDSHETSRPVGG